MKKNRNAFLVTGAAGFIGSGVVKRLLKEGEEVIGIDNLNSYYDPNLKRARLSEIQKYDKGNWSFHKVSIDKLEDLEEPEHFNTLKLAENVEKINDFYKSDI